MCPGSGALWDGEPLASGVFPVPNARWFTLKWFTIFSDSDRYVLMRTRSDGTPLSVQPLSDLDDGRKQIGARLALPDGDEWRLFDLLKNEYVDLES